MGKSNPSTPIMTPASRRPKMAELTLSVAEIRTLAEFAGLRVGGKAEEEDKEVNIVVCLCDERGIKDEDTGEIIHSKHMAYFDEYPEEGCMPL